MFGLISGLYTQCTKKPELRVSILGLDNAGKTTFLHQVKTLLNGAKPFPLDSIPPTIGLNVGKIRFGRVNVLFWDMGGGESLRELWGNYFDESHAILFVVDAADPGRLAEARRELETLLGDSRLRGVPVLVAANKQDRDDALSASEIAQQMGVETVRSRSLQVHGVSGMSQEGMREAVVWITEAVLNSDAAGAGPRALRSDSLV
jgi:ADP-ribosylation factor related protein 1